MNIIKDEFKYRGLRCPIHHIDTRLKSMKSIVGKLEKKDADLSLNVACNNIYDIAGVRVVCRNMISSTSPCIRISEYSKLIYQAEEKMEYMNNVWRDRKFY